MAFEPILELGEYLGNSQVSPGALSGNKFDALGNMVGTAAWREVPDLQEAAEAVAAVPLKPVLLVAAGVVVGVGGTIVAIKAAPKVRVRWNERQLRKQAEDAAELEAAETSTELAEPPIEMSLAEWQERFTAVVTVRALADEQWQLLANARVTDDDQVRELQQAMLSLTPTAIAEGIGLLLEADPNLLEEQTPDELLMMLVHDGKVAD